MAIRAVKRGRHDPLERLAAESGREGPENVAYDMSGSRALVQP
jgi:hypothetical protein